VKGVSTVTLDQYLNDDYLARELRADVRTGLTADPRWLPPKWFYDARGSELFEEITRLPEYYPTRTERAILEEHAGAVARVTEAKTLVELGSGSSEKTRLLLPRCVRPARRLRVSPVRCRRVAGRGLPEPEHPRRRRRHDPPPASSP
jgi:uncharacterized SAM-dependent methyltransferase